MVPLEELDQAVRTAVLPTSATGEDTGEVQVGLDRGVHLAGHK